MLHTNLIAHRASSARQSAAAWRTARRATLIVALMVVLVPLLLATVMSSRATRLREVKEQRLALAETVATHQSLTAEIERLTAPAAIASQSHTTLALWHDLLRELRDRLPAGVWLTEVQVEAAIPGTAGQRVKLEGQADDHEAIGAFVAALTGSPWFATAQLRESDAVEGSDSPYAFQAEAVLRRVVAPPAAPGDRS